MKEKKNYDFLENIFEIVLDCLRTGVVPNPEVRNNHQDYILTCAAVRGPVVCSLLWKWGVHNFLFICGCGLVDGLDNQYLITMSVLMKVTLSYTILFQFPIDEELDWKRRYTADKVYCIFSLIFPLISTFRHHLLNTTI